MNEPLATLKESIVDGVSTLKVSGEIDVSNATHIEESAIALLGDQSSFTLNLSGISFIDSSGVSVLQRLAAICREREGSLQVIARGEGPVDKLLALTGLTQLVDLQLESATS